MLRKDPGWSIRFSRLARLWFLISVCGWFTPWPALIWAQEALSGISSSSGGSSIFTGVNVNELLGASRFYNQGFSGSLAIVATIEGTVPDINFESMSNVTERVYGTGVPSFYQGTHHNHPTAVSHALSGNSGVAPTLSNYYSYGIAYGAETWAGAIATSFTSNGNYNLSSSSVASPYTAMMMTGVDGRTVDVIDSSWWFDNSAGNRRDTLGTDGLANSTGKLLVHIAGNAGPGVNTVQGFGAGYNGITVGALEYGSSANPYSTMASSSSRGPNEVAFATAPNTWSSININVAQRAAVDIVAPGRRLTLPSPINGANVYASGFSGTSFAAPMVAGGAALVIDAGRAIYDTQEAEDARVIKAVLLNSAKKLPGWDNGQSLVGGIVTTRQSLDFSQGAGRLNLDAAYDQYLSPAVGGLAMTPGVAGFERGSLGNVGAVGWDLGIVDAMSVNSYYLDTPLAADSLFSATLAWFVDRSFGSEDSFFGAGEEHFANLDLQIFEFDNLIQRNRLRIVAESVSTYNVVEHLSFEIGSTGYYGVDVRYTGANWNFTGENNETYGLSWVGIAVPEPSSSLLLSVAVFSLAGFNRRCSRRSKWTQP